MEPVQSVEWLEGNMIPFYKLGEVKDEIEAAKTALAGGTAK
jgi:hypothetical protein